ncbi:NAD(P)-dependent oxidoreductase [Clavibacter sp. MX14-G9D]|uniref:NAD-dependent epimerase/dehydratase family protein n=1 Tax=Clavibacter sp. MX14-G9D TaxID=3064656 RepID=UPI00293F1B6F|nr:NAD(P)-dependent oxidoreductase [Clavibacter sp. MX14-G9D]
MTAGLRIVITGAAGLAGRGVRPVLRAAGHRLVLLDLVAADPVGTETALLASVTDLDAVREAVRGADVVVHLGGISRERPWREVLEANVDGTRCVLEAARDAGVRRVLLASSTHAVGFHPVPARPVEHLAPRPDSYYGVSKAAMEALGAVFADRHGMSVVSARIGTVLERPTNSRSLSTWLSFPDLARMIEAVAALDAPGGHVIWGISRNTRAWAGLEAGHAIGYYPQDDAEAHAATIDVGDASEADGLIGGAFADPGHGLGDAW